MRLACSIFFNVVEVMIFLAGAAGMIYAASSTP